MYTLDANVFNRNADERDPDYAECHALIERLHATHQRIIVPAIILAEIAGPLSRFYRNPMRARLYAASVAALPNLTLVTIDDALANVAAELAADYAIRGMDAIYVAVAQRHGCAFVTLDAEPRQRAATVITAQTPAEALAALVPPEV